VTIVGEHVGDALGPHGVHGDAVYEAVALVQAPGEEVQTVQKALSRLRDHGYIFVLEDLADQNRGGTAIVWPAR
jgi:hypothetical protein